MYFIIRNRDNKMPSDPRVRRAAADAWDEAQSLSLRESAKLRRSIIKHKRFEELAERPDLSEISRERARAVRRSMERRINEL